MLYDTDTNLYLSLPNYLPATPEMYGVKQESTSFAQGMDLNLVIPVNINILPSYTLSAILKDSLSSDNILWQGNLTDGGITVNNGVYGINISATTMACLAPNSYFLAIIQSNPALGSRQLMYQQVLTINPSAGSVNAGSSTDYPVTSSVVPAN